MDMLHAAFVAFSRIFALWCLTIVNNTRRTRVLLLHRFCGIRKVSAEQDGSTSSEKGKRGFRIRIAIETGSWGAGNNLLLLRSKPSRLV